MYLDLLQKQSLVKGKAKFKFNGGIGALICSKCGRIIKDGTQFTAEEWLACKGEVKLKPQFCDLCLEKMDKYI